MGEEEVCEKLKATKEVLFKTFYNELLQSISTSYQGDNNSLFNDRNLPTNKEGLLQEVKESYKSLDDYKRKGMLHYACFGLVLAKLKFLYFSKCSFCEVIFPEPD